MPIFEYHCEKCGVDFETIFLSRASAEGAACPKCESSKVTKKLSRFGVSGTSKGDDFDFGGGGDDFGGDDGLDASAGCGRCGAAESCGMD